MFVCGAGVTVLARHYYYNGGPARCATYIQLQALVDTVRTPHATIYVNARSSYYLAAHRTTTYSIAVLHYIGQVCVYNSMASVGVRTTRSTQMPCDAHTHVLHLRQYTFAR